MRRDAHPDAAYTCPEGKERERKSPGSARHKTFRLKSRAIGILINPPLRLRCRARLCTLRCVFRSFRFARTARENVEDHREIDMTRDSSDIKVRRLLGYRRGIWECEGDLNLPLNLDTFCLNVRWHFFECWIIIRTFNWSNTLFGYLKEEEKPLTATVGHWELYKCMRCLISKFLI